MQAILLNPSSIQLPFGFRATEFKFQIQISNLLSKHKGRWNSKTKSYTFPEQNAEEVLEKIGKELNSYFENDDKIKKLEEFDNSVSEPADSAISVEITTEEKEIQDTTFEEVIENKTLEIPNEEDMQLNHYMEFQDEVNGVLAEILKYDNDTKDVKNWILLPYPDSGDLVRAIHRAYPEAHIGICAPEKDITDVFLSNYDGGKVSDLSTRLETTDFLKVLTRNMGGEEGKSLPEKNFIVMDSFANAPSPVIIESIKHAYRMLAEGGRLVCTIDKKRFSQIEEWIEEETMYYRIYKDPSSAFLVSDVYVLYLEN